MKRAFIQFYYKTVRSLGEPAYQILNGFSSVWDQVDPIWVNISLGARREERAIFPEEAEQANEVYCSVWFDFMLTAICEWAKQYPDKKFICGGPAVWPNIDYQIYRPLPINVELRRGLIEDVLGVQWDCKKWKLELPVEERAIYTYYLSDICYWKKCKFCWMLDKTFESKGEASLQMLEKAPPGIVFLQTESISPDVIEQLADLPYKDKTYCFFIRAGKQEICAMEKLLPKMPNIPGALSPIVGVEFPSNRMLDRMGKGVTVADLVTLINIMSSHPSFFVQTTNIAGWPDLVEEDIEAMEEYFTKLEYPERIFSRLRWLILKNGSNPFKSHYRILGYFSEVEGKVLEMNVRFINALNRYKMAYAVVHKDNDPLGKILNFQERKVSWRSYTEATTIGLNEEKRG